MKKRILSSIVIVAIMLIAIASRLLTPYIFDAIMIISGVWATIEMVRAYAKRKIFVSETLASSFVLVLYLVLTLCLMNNVTIAKTLLYFLFTIIGYFVFTFVLSVVFRDITREEMLKSNYMKSLTKYAFVKALRSIYILIYPAMLFVLLIVINHMNDFYVATLTEESTLLSVAQLVDFLIIATFVCATFTDTFALLIGSKVKGKKLCPSISPNKTISGAIGGFVFGLIGVLGVYMLYSLSNEFMTIINALEITWLPVIVLAVLGPIITQIGDILASAIKRKGFIKDYSNLIPGHGGVMDRVDGLIFVGVIAFLIGLVII